MTDEFEKYDIKQVEYTKAGNMEKLLSINNHYNMYGST